MKKLKNNSPLGYFYPSLSDPWRGEKAIHPSASATMWWNKSPYLPLDSFQYALLRKISSLPRTRFFSIQRLFSIQGQQGTEEFDFFFK